jgi:anti-sigma regulatory factor (Ser/Thr protein kinase)
MPPAIYGYSLGTTQSPPGEMDHTELRLPAERIAPALARASIDHIASTLPDHVAADLNLLTTEVVSNAVRHGSRSGADEIIFRIAVDDVVRVDVVDAGGLFEPPRFEPPYEIPTSSGWGLYLVDRLASAWGVEAEGDRKKVWFELDPTTIELPDLGPAESEDDVHLRRDGGERPSR